MERSTKRDSLDRVSGPQSNLRAKRLRMLSRETERNARRNRNACHEMTTAIVREYGRIAVEKLNIRGMTRRARRSGPEAAASESRVQEDAHRPAGGGVPAHDGAAHTSWQIGVPEHNGAAPARNISTAVTAEVPAHDDATLGSASSARRGAGTRNLNREILVQTWGLILQQLRYKAEWAGREFVEVDPRYNAQLCSRCGQAGQRGSTRFTCPSCGFDCDVGLNAAANVLRRGFDLPNSSEVVDHTRVSN